MPDNEEFIDPLRDPRFPDRPQHPDFWRMSDVGLMHDADATESKDGLEKVIDLVVDRRSLMYFAEHRLGNAFKMDLDALGVHGKALVMAIYVDAFCLGADFQRAGGKRDA